MQKKNALDKQIDNLRKKVLNYEKQQNEAAEKENYEEADKLETIIKQVKENLKLIETDSELSYVQYTELENEKQQLYASEESIIDGCLKNIERTVAKKTEEMEKYQESSLAIQRNDRTYIEEESEKVKITRNHLDLDLKHIEEETNSVNDSLDKQTKDFTEEGRSLTDKKQELEETIERIKEELRQKENELKDICKSLESVTNKVNIIKSKFQGSLDKIKNKRDVIQQNEKQYEKDIKHLNEYKETSDKNVKVYAQNIEKYKNLLENMKKMKTEFRKDAQLLIEENRKRELYLKRYSESLAGVNGGRQAIVTCEEEIETLNHKLKQLQAEVTELNAQKYASQQKLPGLEKDKKDFAASRNFKEAQRVNAEIKDIQTQVDTLDKRIQEESDQEKSLTLALLKLQNETIPNLRQKLAKLKEQNDLDKYNLLLIKEKDLKEIYEHYIAQRQFDDSNTIESELRQCQQEISSLKIDLKLEEIKSIILKKTEETPIENIETPVEDVKEEEEQPQDPTQEHIQEHTQEPVQEQIEESKTEADTQHTDENVVEKEVEPPITEEIKRNIITTIVDQIDEIETNIIDLNKKIDEFGANDQFEEADQATSELDKVVKRKNELLETLTTYNLQDVTAAKLFLSQDTSYIQITHDHEQTDNN